MKPHTLVIALTALSATAAAAQSTGDRYGFSRGGYAPTYAYGAPNAMQHGQPAYGRVLTWANKDSNLSPDYGPPAPPPPRRYTSQSYQPQAYQSQARAYAPQGQGYAPQYNTYANPAPAYSAPYQFQGQSVQASPAQSYSPQYASAYVPAQSYGRMTDYSPYTQGRVQQGPPVQRQGDAPPYAEPYVSASTQGQRNRQPTTYIPSFLARRAPQPQGYAPQPQVYGQGDPAYQPQAAIPLQMPRRPQPTYAQPQYAPPASAPPQPMPNSTPTTYLSSTPAPRSYIPVDRPPMSAPARAPARPSPAPSDPMPDLKGGPPPRQASTERFPTPSASSQVTRVPVGRAQSQTPPAAVRVADATPPEQGKVHYYSLHRSFGLTPDTIPPPSPNSNMVLIGPGDNDSGSKGSSEKDDDNASEKPF